MEDRPSELSMLPRRLSSSQTNLSNVSGPALTRPQRHHSGSSSPRRLSGNVTPDMLPRKKSINELTPNMLSRLSVFEQQEEAGDWSAGAGLEDARPRGLRKSSRDGVHGGRRPSKGENYKKERHRLTKEEMDRGGDRSSARDGRGMPIREESLERRRSTGKEYADDLQNSYADGSPDSEQNQPQKSIGIKVFDYLVRRFSSTEESFPRDASAVRPPDYAPQDGSESQTSEKEDDVLNEEHLSSTGYGRHTHMLDSTPYETHDYFYEEKDSEVYALNDEQVSLTDSTEMLEPKENRKKTIDSELFGFVVRRINDIENMSNTDTESEGLIDFEDDDDVLSRSAKVTSYYESTLRQKEKEKETAKRLAIIQDENGRILPTIEIEEADQFHDMPDFRTRAAGHKKKKTSMAKGILNYLFRNRISDLEAAPVSEASPVESRVLESPSSKAEEAVRDFLAESCVANPLPEVSEGGVVKAEVPSAYEGHDEDLAKDSDLVSSTTEEENVRSSESFTLRLLKWTVGMMPKAQPDDYPNTPTNPDQPDDNLKETNEKLKPEVIPEEAEGPLDEDESLAQKSDMNANFLEQNQSDDRDLVILVMSLILVVYILTL
ncbi:uncharacterized protein LOC134772247 [Penaeus indicus]|uniref:uncharacterized protein LOC134772247 n=1 Tax=Penaeus indicus TaxID=29960 RepID=UPI00300D5FD9